MFGMMRKMLGKKKRNLVVALPAAWCKPPQSFEAIVWLKIWIGGHCFRIDELARLPALIQRGRTYL